MKQGAYIQPSSIALSISLMATAACAAFASFYDLMNWREFSMALGVFFILCFFLLRDMIYRFIDQRIKLIYKSIYTKKKSRSQFFSKHNDHERLLQGVEEEVEEWIRKRDAELEEMKKLESYRRDFVGNVSHELKTPIFTIQGYIHTLIDGGMEDTEIRDKYLERCSKSIDRMISIVSDLEVISKLENNKVELEKNVFDPVVLLREVYADLEMKAQQAHVDLLMSFKVDPVPKVLADKRQIKQVFTNLIENSIRYRGEKSCYTKVSFYDMHEKLFIEFSDNGIGMEEEDLSRIFERFYRTDKARSREKGGSGLGLAIVKHILEAHEQNISARSSIGKGTTFSITLDKAQ